MPIAYPGRIPRPARTHPNRRGTEAVTMGIGCWGVKKGSVSPVITDLPVALPDEPSSPSEYRGNPSMRYHEILSVSSRARTRSLPWPR